MNLYRTLDTEYRTLARNTLPASWCLDVDSFDALVDAIRTEDALSDMLLGRLVEVAPVDARAVIVASFALMPLLRARLGRSATDEYRNDALTELTIVILDAPTVGAHLARRLVNRAHTRAHKAARRVTHRGVVHLVEIAPTDPDILTRCGDARCDVADEAVERADLARFHAAVTAVLSPSQLDAYRQHRLRRVLDASAPACTAVQRKLASRATARIQPLIDEYLHAA